MEKSNFKCGPLWQWSRSGSHCFWWDLFPLSDPNSSQRAILFELWGSSWKWNELDQFGAPASKLGNTESNHGFSYMLRKFGFQRKQWTSSNWSLSTRFPIWIHSSNHKTNPIWFGTKPDNQTCLSGWKCSLVGVISTESSEEFASN